MVCAIPAFNDNYIWIIQPGDRRRKAPTQGPGSLHSGSGATELPENRARVAVVDPGDAAPVIRFLEQHDLALGAILITHHHADHVGGIEDLLQHAALAQGIDDLPKVYGPAAEPIASVNVPLAEGDEVWLEGCDAPLRVIEVPGHTRGHIAYVGEIEGDGPCLFCGDTLFAAGCGRLFEGSAVQMWSSLQKLAALPPATRVFCAHEYTLSNLKFAAHALPANADIAQRLAQVSAMRARNEITLPSTISTELCSNPFLLCSDAEQFAAMRKEKDGFRG